MAFAAIMTWAARFTPGFTPGVWFGECPQVASARASLRSRIFLIFVAVVELNGKWSMELPFAIREDPQ